MFGLGVDPMEAIRKIEQGIASLQAGKPILLFDYPDREAETDLVFLAQGMTPRKVLLLRKVPGAPLTVYLPHELAAALNLPMASTAFAALHNEFPILSELASDRRGHDPSFSFTLDHRENVTGCSAKESAHTIRRLAYYADHYKEHSATDLARSFVKEFKTPGHIPVIICAEGLLHRRNGHAELSMTIVQMGRLSKATVAAEMIHPRTGESMSRRDAIRFGEKRGIVFVEGEEVIQAARSWCLTTRLS